MRRGACGRWTSSRFGSRTRTDGIDSPNLLQRVRWVDALSVNISININLKVGTLVTSGEDALRKGKEEDLKKVWIATELQWVVSEEEVVEFDKEEDSWSEVQDLVSSQF